MLRLCDDRVVARQIGDECSGKSLRQRFGPVAIDGPPCIAGKDRACDDPLPRRNFVSQAACEAEADDPLRTACDLALQPRG